MPLLSELLPDSKIKEIQEKKPLLHWLSLQRLAAKYFGMTTDGLWNEINQHNPNTVFSYGAVEMAYGEREINQMLRLYRMAISIDSYGKVKFHFPKSHELSEEYKEQMRLLAQLDEEERERQEQEYLEHLKREAEIKTDFGFRSPKSARVISRCPKSMWPYKK